MVEKQADLYNIQQKFLEIVYGFSGGEVSKAHELTTWTNGWKGLGCIPAGSDAVSIGSRHLEIHKTSGAFCKKSTDSFVIHARCVLALQVRVSLLYLGYLTLVACRVAKSGGFGSATRDARDFS